MKGVLYVAQLFVPPNDDRPEHARKLGEWLREQLKERKWSQADLYRFTGILPPYISRMVKGKATQPTVAHLVALAQAFATTPHEILEKTGWWTDPVGAESELTHEQRLAAQYMAAIPAQYQGSGVRALQAVFAATAPPGKYADLWKHIDS
jgi:transcriptional regulator with XRE-family HTH domain